MSVTCAQSRRTETGTGRSAASVRNGTSRGHQRRCRALRERQSVMRPAPVARDGHRRAVAKRETARSSSSDCTRGHCRLARTGGSSTAAARVRASVTPAAASRVIDLAPVHCHAWRRTSRADIEHVEQVAMHIEVAEVIGADEVDERRAAAGARRRPDERARRAGPLRDEVVVDDRLAPRRRNLEGVVRASVRPGARRRSVASRSDQ